MNEALQIIDPKSKIEILATACGWTKDALWNKKKANYWYVFDIPKYKVLQARSKK